MLSKKQYLYTLFIAIAVFILVFLVTYFYTKQNSWHIEQSDEPIAMSGLSVEQWPEEIYILPQTKIVLKNQNTKGKAFSETKVDSKSLLGLTKDEVADRFKGYTIETFNEKEVTLVKDISQEQKLETPDVTYVLGVDDHYVCIKEKGTTKRPVKIDYEVAHFSKYIYSLLLNEEIEITNAQKEALLLNPSTLQKILQGYVGE
ncbi:MAG: hypothetical protein E7231_00130 [Cellulosilyticum sp.]|nr:hypothetical protein [Cellulosilyticum sp.]